MQVGPAFLLYAHFLPLLTGLAGVCWVEKVLHGSQFLLFELMLRLGRGFSLPPKVFPPNSFLFLCVYFMMFEIKWEEDLSKAVSQIALYGPS